MDTNIGLKYGPVSNFPKKVEKLFLQHRKVNSLVQNDSDNRFFLMVLCRLSDVGYTTR